MRCIIINIKILITMLIFLCFNLSYSHSQERVDTREKARQHYQQGKEFYSQGRYQEATTEFEKAASIITPSTVEFMEKVQREQEKVLAPAPSESAPSQGATTEFKRATPIITPSTVEFMEKVQKKEEKVLAPPTPKLAPLSEEKLPEKEKEEEEEKEDGEEEEEILPLQPVTIEKTPPVTEEAGGEEREYYIDIGDVLDISVWQTPDLSRPDIIVRPDGKISLPLIGDVKAQGATLTKLDDIVTEKLKAYVKAPEVSIMLRRFGEHTNKVIVLGEILSPGVYNFGLPPTISEVLAAAGGYTKYAVLNSVMVIRGDVKTKPEAIRVNFAQIIKSGRLSQNILLNPNDIIYVPRSFIGKINVFLELIQPAISEYMQTMNARHFQHILHRN